MVFINKNKISNKIKTVSTIEMEIAVKEYFAQASIVVPNISWGMFSHECDIISVSKSGYCTETEIKISASDLKKDKEKRHKHIDGNGYRKNKIKHLYFAIPFYLEKYIDHIPEKAGILIAYWLDYGGVKRLKISKLRNAEKQSDYKLSEKEQNKILWLMHHRIWLLKKHLSKIKKRLTIS